MSTQPPWPVGPQLGLIEWLGMDHRPDRAFLPPHYVSIAEFLARLCADRAKGEKVTPWLQADCEAELRYALCDRKLIGWRLTDAGPVDKIEPTAWANEFIWHRAKTMEDMAKPDTDYEGFDVPANEWRDLIDGAKASGLFVLDCADVLHWLRNPASARPAHLDQRVDKRRREGLEVALRAHMGFDLPNPPWASRDAVVEEVQKILVEHKLQNFLADRKSIANAIRPLLHKQAKRPSKHQLAEMKAWKESMAQKRSAFRP